MLSEWMQLAAVKSIAAGVEAEMLFGTVTAALPLRVQIDERFTLEGEALILPHYLERQEFHLLHDADEHTLDKTFIFEEGLQVGDRVILLGLSGEYLIVGKVGEAGAVRQVCEG